MSTTASRKFTFNGGPAGIFAPEANLQILGPVSYVPYRGISHYEMGKAIRKYGFAVVEVEDCGSRRALKISHLAYGILEILASNEKNN